MGKLQNIGNSISFRSSVVLAGLMSIALLLPSCLDRQEYSQEDMDALIQKEVDKRIADFIRIREERCQEDLLKEANRLADSMMIVLAFFDRDTFSRPEKPEKPERPELKILRDSSPIAPLFERRKSAPVSRDSSEKN